MLTALSGAAWAETEQETPLNGLLWLANWPDWALVLLLVTLTTVFALLVFSLLRRAFRAPVNPWARATATLGGAALGLLLALLGAESWHAYVSESMTRMPPTASGLPAQAQARGVRAKLLEEPDAEAAARRPDLPAKALAGRARHAKVNFNALEAATLELNLFDDVTLIAVQDSVVKNLQGGDVWVGHIANDPDSQVVLAVKGRALMGTVEYEGRAFEIVFVNGATHAVRELDPNALPPQFEPAEPQPDHDAMMGDTSTSTSTDSVAGDGSSSGQVIDVLVVYTPLARSNAGGASGIEAKILNAVTRANQAYLNSQVTISLNLVGMAETNYVETNAMSTSVSRLRATTDGFMDEVHTLRNQLGADIVMLITADTDACGVAYRMTSLSNSFASSAFGVVHDDSRYNCLGSNNTFAHEIGHIQGNMHDLANSSGTPIYPDSYGYQVCGQYRDIMSYSCAGEIRIPYFSNPEVLWNGNPTGVWNSANTARSMNATAATIAAFRTPPATVTLPNAPTMLVASSGVESVVLTWTDNATNESGFIVQRSTDGINWSQIASLGANTVSFTNSGLTLTGNQSYSYRVQAFNSAGNSAFSNIATTTPTAQSVVPAAPVDTTPPQVSISSPSNGATLSANTSIRVSATDNVAIGNLRLLINGQVVSSTNTGTINYTWNVKKAAKGTNTLRAEASDSAGNAANTQITVTVR